MKENVEVVVKVGFKNKEMSIMTTSYESPEEDDSKYATLYDSKNRPYMKVKTKEDE